MDVIKEMVQLGRITRGQSFKYLGEPEGVTDMAYFSDLMKYTYIPEHEATVRNVGWLDADHPFEKRETSGAFIEKLSQPCVNATVKRTPGIHICRLCPPMRFGFHMIQMDG